GEARAAAPVAVRPHMPGYGLPETTEGLLPWRWAEVRLIRAHNYWVGTTRPDGRPHAMPVWGVWVGGAFYFGTGHRSRKARNLAANPAMVVHLERGNEAVIVEGRAAPVRSRAGLEAVDREYLRKYRMRLTTHADSLVFAFRPSIAFGWRERDFPKSATRWRFPA
ncbi:MAG TPA: pyridoxamine 5'-phosphate oxidase family protein, partial [Candidatus Tectomicrobia bacterium]|nr:pyridoxamine 5'-phosphate oxidase family protein [Candidatus Tectomicrobia bacterium]